MSTSARRGPARTMGSEVRAPRWRKRARRNVADWHTICTRSRHRPHGAAGEESMVRFEDRLAAAIVAVMGSGLLGPGCGVGVVGGGGKTDTGAPNDTAAPVLS